MIDIAKVLEKHAKWRKGEEGGERANLSRADLSGANLSRADLSGADLSGANLSGANLSRADLSGADLSGANLLCADLLCADLLCADLSRANLYWADLSGAYLSRADLSGANLSRANLSRANLSRANGLPNIDAFDINSAVADACKNPDALEMGAWHTCATTHCRAGWAVVLHPQGKLLESIYGTNAAAALIYNACAGFVPNFYASNDDAMKDIIEKAK